MKKIDTISRKKIEAKRPRCMTVDSLSASKWPGQKFTIKVDSFEHEVYFKPIEFNHNPHSQIVLNLPEALK